MIEVTVIQGAAGFVSPKHVNVNLVLDQIKNCSIQKQIDRMRAETDKKKKRSLKEKLPAIMFCGKFKSRGDANIQIPSGFCVMDFDHLKEPELKKQEVIKNPFVYSAFISPSGDGLKVVCKTPPIIEQHKGRYIALLKYFNQTEIDESCKNLERLCFASCDPNIYINENATEFMGYVETVSQKTSFDLPGKQNTDYFKINIAAKMIREAGDGEKLKILLRASKLLGGYIASGCVDETDAIYSLESEISKKNIDDFDVAKKAIVDGIKYGKNFPIFESEEFKQYKPKYFSNGNSTVTTTEIINDNFDFVATEKDTDGYIEQVRSGTFQMGLNTGFPILDEYFRFKPATLVVINGHDNTGKSILMWYFATLSALFHKWKWIIYSNENKLGGIKKRIIEFYKCKSIKDYSDDELSEAKKWFDLHFTIIKNTELFTYKDMISIGTKLNQKKKYDAFLIDPYNSLWAETNDRHEYDYKAMTEFRQFITQTGCGIYLNCHAITEALRRKYPKDHSLAGYPMPPDKADTEGGGKFSNKADDFITLHRLVQHPHEWMFTEIHVKKIKEMETGGKHTFLESPVKLRMIPGSCGFEDVTGFNPITGKTYIQTEIKEERISEPKEKDDLNLPF